MNTITLASTIVGLLTLQIGPAPVPGNTGPHRSVKTKKFYGRLGPTTDTAPMATLSTLTSHVFTGNLNQGNDSSQHSFSVPGDADYVLVTLAMGQNNDFDVRLWDNQNRRTGGWISSDFATRTEIPNSNYSGYSNYDHRIREWITVKPTQTSGTWKVRCYAYSGSGAYTIRVLVRGGYSEEGTKEVGVEWINDYPGSDNDRQHRDDSAKDFRDNLGSEGWSKPYTWSQNDVWERDYKSKLYISGGSYNDETVTDSVDIALYAGHGSKGNSWDTDPGMSYDAGMLSLSNSSNDDSSVAPHDAYMSWGDQDLEWIGLDCCHALRSPWEWAQAMNGLHLICGFSTRSYEDCLFGSWKNVGNYWSDHMIDDDPNDDWWWNWDEEKTVKQAWFDAADDAMGTAAWIAGRCIKVRVVGENNACGDDYLWGQGSVTSDPVHDNTYEEWKDEVGRCSPPPAYHPVEGTTIMLYSVVQPVVDETYVKALAAIFGIDPTRPVHTEVKHGVTHYYMAENKHTLVVSEAGGIKYMDLSSLWMTVDEPPDLPADPRSTAEAFLTANSLMPADAVFLSVTEDTQTSAYSVLEQDRPPNGEPTEEDHIIETIVTNYVVRFERTIDGYPVSSGLSVYVGEGGAILGLKKIWREVQADTVADLIPEQDAIDLFNTYHSRFSVIGFPIGGDIAVTNTGLAYYDFGDGVMQDQLMPVYVFEFELDGETERIAVPAVESFVPPIPSITSPSDGAAFYSDEVLQFDGTCIYGTAPYSFEWSSNEDGVLGVGASISVGDLSVARHSITLRVTDDNGATKEDVVSIIIVPRIPAVSTWGLILMGLLICVAASVLLRRFGTRAVAS